MIFHDILMIFMIFERFLRGSWIPLLEGPEPMAWVGASSPGDYLPFLSSLVKTSQKPSKYHQNIIIFITF